MTTGLFNYVYAFHTAAVAVGDGTEGYVDGLAAVGVQIVGIVAGDVVTFEATQGTTWDDVQGVNLGDGSVATTAAVSGLFLVPVAGMKQFRCRISATAGGGTITVTGLGVINAPGVTLADIDIAAAEAFTLAASSVAAAAFVAGSQLDGHSATLGAMANNRATQTDTTAVSVISLLKQISYMEQTPASRAVTIATAPATPTSELHIGEVGGNSIHVTVTPTITAGAYTEDDVIGAIQTLTNAARVSGKPTTLDTLVITDLAMQDADMVLWFFNANPANGTYTDNLAYDIHDTDLAMCVGWVDVASSDYKDATDNSVACVRNIGLKMTPNASRNLFCIAQTKVGDTWATTSDVSFIYGFSPD